MPKHVKARTAQDEQEERMVRKLARFNAEGIAGLGMRPESGCKARLTEQERSRILALVKQTPPEHLETQAVGSMVARDEAAKAAGIQVKRSQTRHIYRREGVRWQHTHSWGDSLDPDFVRSRLLGRLRVVAAARGVDDRLHR